MFELPRWMRRNFRGISAEGKVIDGKMRCKFLQKRSTGKKNKSVPKTCDILPLKKILFQNLTDAFFQYL